ncbi:hypothetical protein D3C78_1553560 [compost metagenome]
MLDERFCCNTVPTRLATQMNINRLTANRIEPSSSKKSPGRLRKEGRVWVRVEFMKKGGPRDRLPPS